MFTGYVQLRDRELGLGVSLSYYNSEVAVVRVSAKS